MRSLLSLFLFVAAPISAMACQGRLATNDSKLAASADASTGGSTSSGPGCAPAPACVSVSVLPPLQTFSSKAEADSILAGEWTVCPDSPPIDGAPFAVYGDGDPVPGIFSLGTSFDGRTIMLRSTLVEVDAGEYSIQYDPCAELVLLTSTKDPSLTVALARGEAPASPPPPTGCSLLGTFDSTSHWDGQLASFQFNADGTFVGGAPGADLPTEAKFSGTFVASNDELEILATTGMQCPASAASPLSWDSTCSHVTITTHYDDCTGGRLYLGGGDETDLTRR